MAKFAATVRVIAGFEFDADDPPELKDSPERNPEDPRAEAHERQKVARTNLGRQEKHGRSVAREAERIASELALEGATILDVTVTEVAPK